MKRILIADDVEENRYLLEALLGGSGFEVQRACNGVQALEIARQTPPDLLVTDLLMPEMDGFELCRQFHRDPALATTPILVYTATYVQPEDERLALSLGATRFMLKPQEPDILLGAVQELTRGEHKGLAAEKERQEELLRRHNAVLMRKLEQKIRRLNAEISRRDRLEAELRQNARLLRVAARLGTLAGWRVDLTTHEITWSEELFEILGKDPGSQPSSTLLAHLVVPESAEMDRANFEACAREGKAYDAELEILLPGGGRKWCRVIGQAVRDDSGAIVAVEGALQDISEFREAERQRQALAEQRLQAQKLESLGRLAGGMAHDFNNLVAVILSYADFALRELGADHPARADVEEIQAAGRRAGQLTRQLLAFSRKQPLVPEALDLDQVVADMHAMLNRLLGESIELVVRLAPSPTWVLADPGQLEQVLMNLALNARDAMPEGGRLLIQTEVMEGPMRRSALFPSLPDGDYLLLTVQDSGHGIAPEALGQIFDPFFTTRGPDQGAGLGLPTVYGIVRQSGGEIHVESTPGEGSTFRICLPRIDPLPEAPAPQANPETEQPSESILLVEDDPAVRRVAERILRGAGFRVRTAAHGHEALETCQRDLDGIDLLVTDLVMPRMSGLELAERLEMRHPGLRTLFVSGYTDALLPPKEAWQANRAFIAKPFAADSLTRKVRELLDARPQPPRSSD